MAAVFGTAFLIVITFTVMFLFTIIIIIKKKH